MRVARNQRLHGSKTVCRGLNQRERERNTHRQRERERKEEEDEDEEEKRGDVE